MELIRININKYSFSFLGGLLTCTQEPLIKSLTHGELDSLHYLYPPFFLKRKEELILIGRYWVFFHCLRNQIDEFNAFIIKDEKKIKEILKLDSNEQMILSRLNQPKQKSPSRITKDRNKKKDEGMVCPFCKKTVRRLNRKEEREKDGGYAIHCENNILTQKSKNYEKRCMFYLTLTAYENDLLNRNNLGLPKIIVRIDGKQCQKCRSPLYLRTIHKQDSTTIFEQCHGFFNNMCDHNKKMDIGDNHSTNKEVTE